MGRSALRFVVFLQPIPKRSYGSVNGCAAATVPLRDHGKRFSIDKRRPCGGGSFIADVF
ncbi:hypothetical protein RugamoR64_62000 [Duganella rhizosphaerae]